MAFNETQDRRPRELRMMFACSQSKQKNSPRGSLQRLVTFFEKS